MRVVFAGGGTAGHVVPNLALISELRERRWDVAYVGTASGLEATLAARAGVPFFPIHAGKLRRYASWRTAMAPALTLYGVLEAVQALRRLRPAVVFSKGGFAAFPLAPAAKICGIPLILHESDLTPGLANKLALPFAAHVCTAFAETPKRIRTKVPTSVTGIPLPREIGDARAERAAKRFGFSDGKPLLLVMGGSQGSEAINRHVRALVPELVNAFEIVHLCGRGKLDAGLAKLAGYHQLEYVHEGYYDLLACAALVVSRAGANSLEELRTLAKPHVLIPLSGTASRGDQVLNAAFFKERYGSVVMEEASMTPATLADALRDAQQTAEAIRGRLSADSQSQSRERVVRIIEEVAQGRA
jgi:UDP-N-acetylglucosamine--N-acetylmuramyl-(pentapeptide) pyrophosphoryl-undecaprenol N-acetylglucosamine transferase